MLYRCVSADCTTTHSTCLSACLSYASLTCSAKPVSSVVVDDGGGGGCVGQVKQLMTTVCC